MLRRLAESLCRVGALAKGFAVSRPAICKHARLLMKAGLIESRKSGRERIYRLAPTGGKTIKDLIVKLEELGRFRDVVLDTFKRYAEDKNDHTQVDQSEATAGDFIQVFCEEMSEWWPGGFGGMDVKLFIEGQVGGRFYERYTDGTEYEIGRITAYEPPRVVAFTWRAPSWDTSTQVKVRFIADGAGTRTE